MLTSLSIRNAAHLTFRRGKVFLIAMMLPPLVTAAVVLGLGLVLWLLPHPELPAAGRRRMLLPSQVERGHRPVPASKAWFSATAPSAQGQTCGAAASIAPAPRWQATLALTNNGGCHGAGVGRGGDG